MFVSCIRLYRTTRKVYLFSAAYFLLFEQKSNERMKHVCDGYITDAWRFPTGIIALVIIRSEYRQVERYQDNVSGE